MLDSGSIDGTQDVATRHGATVHRDRPTSVTARARNRLMELTSGDHVAFLTQDAEPADPSWLRTLRDGFADDRVGLVCGPYLPRPAASPVVRRELEAWFASMRDGAYTAADLGDPPAPGPAAFASSANLCLSRAAWREVPFRDVPYAEDQRLVVDLLQAGWTKVFTSRAAVIHSHALRRRRPGPPLVRRVPRAARRLRLDGARQPARDRRHRAPPRRRPGRAAPTTSAARSPPPSPPAPTACRPRCAGGSRWSSGREGRPPRGHRRHGHRGRPARLLPAGPARLLHGHQRAAHPQLQHRDLPAGPDGVLPRGGRPEGHRADRGRGRLERATRGPPSTSRPTSAGSARGTSCRAASAARRSASTSRRPSGTESARVCIRNAGRGQAVPRRRHRRLPWASRSRPSTGRPAAVRTAFWFRPPAGEKASLLFHLPTLFERAALFRPGWVGPWTYWLLFLVVIPALAYAALRVLLHPQRRRLALTVGAIGFGFAAVWAHVTPAFDAPDETEHFAYVQSLAERGKTLERAPTERADLLVRRGRWRCASPACSTAPRRRTASRRGARATSASTSGWRGRPAPRRRRRLRGGRQLAQPRLLRARGPRLRARPRRQRVRRADRRAPGVRPARRPGRRLRGADRAGDRAAPTPRRRRRRPRGRLPADVRDDGRLREQRHGGQRPRGGGHLPARAAAPTRLHAAL